jgi:hypothetical protein
MKNNQNLRCSKNDGHSDMGKYLYEIKLLLLVDLFNSYSHWHGEFVNESQKHSENGAWNHVGDQAERV